MYRFTRSDDETVLLISESEFEKSKHLVINFIYRHYNVKFKNTRTYNDLEDALLEYPKLGFIIEDYKNRFKKIAKDFEYHEIRANLHSNECPQNMRPDVFQTLVAFEKDDFWNESICRELSHLLKIYHNKETGTNFLQKLFNLVTGAPSVKMEKIT